MACVHNHLHDIFSDRNDEKVTCQKVLDKMGLQGYQVSMFC